MAGVKLEEEQELWEQEEKHRTMPLWRPSPTVVGSTPEHQEEDPQPEASILTKNSETVFSPEVCKQDFRLLYRFRCPSSGTFRCSSTGLVFVVTKEVELQYKIVQWDEALLQLSDRTPAGPLYDIESQERAVCELHLPHCEVKNAVLSQSQLSVAHFTDSGLTLVEPLRITETHVVIHVSSLSLFGNVWRRWFEPHHVRGQVLLFHAPREQRVEKFEVHLLPIQTPIEEVQSKCSPYLYVRAPSDCELVIRRFYVLNCDCPSAEIQPKRGRFHMDNGPNYHPTFELLLSPNTGSASITVREENSEKEVWKYRLKLPGGTSRDDPGTSRDDPGRLY